MSAKPRARLRHQEEITAEPFEGGSLQWLVDPALGAEHVMAYRLTLIPNGTLSHVHSGSDEVLYVLEGRGEIRVVGSSHAVAAGQAVFVPDGAQHSYVNTDERPLVIVGAMAPPIDSMALSPNLPSRAGGGRPARSIDEGEARATTMDEQQVTPTLMGERSFRVLVSPAMGCRSMTQFTGVIPTGRAPLHAHPHEEAVFLLAGHGKLWIEGEAVGELRPGSVVFFPIGVRHTLENTGRENMRVLGAFSPAGSPEAKLPPA